MLNAVAQTIYDKKGRNILAIDVRNISTVTDYFLIAEGSVERHVQALGAAIDETIKDLGLVLYRSEGKTTGEWIVLDCGDILIHLFLPELREKYALEELWQEGEIVDLHIKLKDSQ
ncbi:MAG: ribosome silencing factor [Waddliaceae bacterium]